MYLCICIYMRAHLGNLRRARLENLQGCLALRNSPPYDPRYSPTVGP